MEKKKENEENEPEKVKVMRFTNEGTFYNELYGENELKHYFLNTCISLAAPIISYLLLNEQATKEQLLEFNQRYQLMQMIDLEDRLDLLKEYNLISIDKSIVRLNLQNKKKDLNKLLSELNFVSKLKEIFNSYKIQNWINEYCLDKNYNDFLNEIKQLLGEKIENDK